MSGADPVESGMIASLSRPGGNLTGFSVQVPDLAGKRIELLRELVPGLRRSAIIVNIANPDNSQEVAEAQSAAHKLGLDVHMLEVRRAEDIVPAFGTLMQALYVSPDPLINANMRASTSSHATDKVQVSRRPAAPGTGRARGKC
jgi:putative ABC transport system substrate-binding protein